jgi:hypothetical protein
LARRGRGDGRERESAVRAPTSTPRLENGKLIPSLSHLSLQDTEALARKIAAAGGGRVELGEIKWR